MPAQILNALGSIPDMPTIFDEPTQSLNVCYLPFRILASKESIQYTNPLLQSTQPLLLLRLKLLRTCVLSQHLCIQILPVRCSTHSRTENRLNHEAMMRRQRALVRIPEAISQLLLGLLLRDADTRVVGEICTKGLGGEVEAADEPEEAFGCFVGFGGQLGFAEGLEGGGVGWGGQLTLTDFLDVADHVIFDGVEGYRAEEVWRE